MGESRTRLRPLFNGSTIVRECGTLAEAVAAAMERSRPGSTVLFSPACASFDMFRDFEARGRAFKALVHQLAQRSGRRGQETGAVSLAPLPEPVMVR